MLDATCRAHCLWWPRNGIALVSCKSADLSVSQCIESWIGTNWCRFCYLMDGLVGCIGLIEGTRQSKASSFQRCLSVLVPTGQNVDEMLYVQGSWISALLVISPPHNVCWIKVISAAGYPYLGGLGMYLAGKCLAPAVMFSVFSDIH